MLFIHFRGRRDVASVYPAAGKPRSGRNDSLPGGSRVSERYILFVLALLLSTASSCCQRDASSESKYRTSGDEFSVMTYNLKRYCYDDRDRDGQDNDPKPEEEVRAVIELIARTRPDVLAVQEMGAPELFKDFQSRLATKGLSYPHTEYIPGTATNLNNAVLSRYPFASRQSFTNDEYTIGDEVIPVRRGYISVDVQVAPSYRFRLMVAHLKSKVFHPLDYLVRVLVLLLQPACHGYDFALNEFTNTVDYSLLQFVRFKHDGSYSSAGDVSGVNVASLLPWPFVWSGLPDHRCKVMSQERPI